MTSPGDVQRQIDSLQQQLDRVRARLDELEHGVQSAGDRLPGILRGPRRFRSKAEFQRRLIHAIEASASRRPGEVIDRVKIDDVARRLGIAENTLKNLLAYHDMLNERGMAATLRILLARLATLEEQ